jgi:hypothetical protein
MRFDPKTRRYIDENGHVLSPAQVRREVHDYVEQEKSATEKEALKLLAGTITIAGFFHYMKSRVEKWHTVTGSIAYGGRAQLDPEREARIAAKITSELTYLAGFRDDTTQAMADARDAGIALDEALGFVANRAGMYADAAYSTFVNNTVAREFDNGVTLGRRECAEDDASCEECVAAASTYFQPLDEIPEIGTLTCLNNCRCDIITADAPLTATLAVQDRAQQSDAVQ